MTQNALRSFVNCAGQTECAVRSASLVRSTNEVFILIKLIERYECQECGQQFDDLSGTIFEGHHQPLRVWVLCLYFMGLNLSNEQIGAELDVSPGDAQEMTSQLRKSIVDKKSLFN